MDRINPPGLPTPSGYAHAVLATGSRIVFLAGQTATDTDGRITGSTMVEQFERALDNMLTALRAAGGQPIDLASVTMYTVDMDGYRANARAIGRVWRRLAGTDYPAMAGLGVARLWDREALVELQGVAVLP
ncbi:MAG: RidA family protein [Kutzneria sp.]|nr:RidA family protein [Kutzneria sp.]MBV9847467.1 RidA family protein [Kutzneria sp.]